MPTTKEQELNFLFLPVVEFVYFRNGLFELYGSAAVGVDFTRRSEKNFPHLSVISTYLELLKKVALGLLKRLSGNPKVSLLLHGKPIRWHYVWAITELEVSLKRD